MFPRVGFIHIKLPFICLKNLETQNNPLLAFSIGRWRRSPGDLRWSRHFFHSKRGSSSFLQMKGNGIGLLVQWRMEYGNEWMSATQWWANGGLCWARVINPWLPGGCLQPPVTSFRKFINILIYSSGLGEWNITEDFLIVWEPCRLIRYLAYVLFRT